MKKPRVFAAALIAGVAVGAVQLVPAADSAAEGVERIFESVRGHSFHPLDESSFTIDRDLKQHGVANLEDEDWKVRLLAVRDLIRAGAPAAAEIARGLGDSNLHVRYASAAALGVLRAEAAIPALEEALRSDTESLVRSQTAIALGQIESAGSIAMLREKKANDPSKDVRHQCELSIDQIQKKMGATEELRAAFVALDPAKFESVRVGAPAPDFALPDTEGNPWRLAESKGKEWTVLIWVFADWCPVCHGEFRELIEMREEFERAGVRVATIETHDRYRARVMVGREIDPEYWFAKESFHDAYTRKIWWPHLLDRAGGVGAVYGVDPMEFSVHSEFINRPSTIIIDPDGIVRFAYYGTFWGDRPSVRQTLGFIEAKSFTFEHAKRRRAPVSH